MLAMTALLAAICVAGSIYNLLAAMAGAGFARQPIADAVRRCR